METKYDKYLYFFLIVLAIFIIGVQVGIKHGRELQIEELKVQDGYYFTN